MDPSEKPDQIHQFSGVVTEHAQMYDSLTGLQNLVFYGTLFGVSAAESSSRALALLGQLNLTDAKDKKLDTYSTGMRQRLSLAQAMIHHPKILFLKRKTDLGNPFVLSALINTNIYIKSIGVVHSKYGRFLCIISCNAGRS